MVQDIFTVTKFSPKRRDSQKSTIFLFIKSGNEELFTRIIYKIFKDDGKLIEPEFLYSSSRKEIHKEEINIKIQ